MSKRPADTPMGSSEKEKMKHLCLTIPQKVKLLEQFDRGVDVKSLTEEFGVGKTTIYDFKKQKENHSEIRKILKTDPLPVPNSSDKRLYTCYKNIIGAKLSSVVLLFNFFPFCSFILYYCSYFPSFQVGSQPVL